LLFDADGNGTTAAVQCATLDSHPTTTIADFMMILVLGYWRLTPDAIAESATLAAVSSRHEVYRHRRRCRVG